MKKLLLALAGVLFLATSAFAELTKVPGIPDVAKKFEQSSQRFGMCPDGRFLIIKLFAKDAKFEYAGLAIFEDDGGEFVWVYYTDKNEEADISWIVFKDAQGTFWKGTVKEVSEKIGSSPCDIARPLPGQKNG